MFTHPNSLNTDTDFTSQKKILAKSLVRRVQAIRYFRSLSIKTIFQVHLDR